MSRLAKVGSIEVGCLIGHRIAKALVKRLLGAIVVGVSVIAGLATPVYASSPQVVVFIDSGCFAGNWYVKPSGIPLSCATGEANIGGIKWGLWATQDAVGSGVFYFQGLDTKEDTIVHVDVVLFDPQPGPAGIRHFSQLTWYAPRASASWGAAGEEDVRPPAHWAPESLAWEKGPPYRPSS